MTRIQRGWAVAAVLARQLWDSGLLHSLFGP